jgi:hypothetical protein
MRYEYIAAYKSIGVERPKGRKEEVLIEPSPSSRVLLTYDLENHLFELDKRSVVATVLLCLQHMIQKAASLCCNPAQSHKQQIRDIL